MKTIILFISFFTPLVSWSISVSPGHVSFISLELSAPPASTYVKCKNKNIPFDQVSEKKIYFYIGQSYFSNLSPYSCSISLTNGKKKNFTINLKKYAYPETKLNVAKKYVALSKENLERHKREKKKLKKIYNESAPIFLFDTPFMKPLNSILTSYYGSRRVFNNTRKTQHLGNDFRAKTGVEIPSSNSGKVVLAEELFFPGKTVIIDHGLGIFSMYGHLSEIQVKVGTMIKKGEIVGKAGATGRVTGAHLHWGVKVQGNWVDGITLVKESAKHFADLNKVLRKQAI